MIARDPAEAGAAMRNHVASIVEALRAREALQGHTN
jgi:hypothetical protein